MITLLDNKPKLNNSFLHQKMRMLDTYGDCLWYSAGDGGIMCTRQGYAIVDCALPCDRLKETLAILGISGVLTNSPHFDTNKVLMQINCSGQNANADFKVFDVCKQVALVFGLPFDDLYTRTSHMVRHGCGSVYQRDSAVAIVAHNVLEGVCSTDRGKGHAKALIQQIASAHSGVLYCLCSPQLAPFYESCGFDTVMPLTEETL